MFSALQNLLNVLPRSKNSDLSLPLPGLQLLNSCALTQLRLGLGSSGVLSPPSSETLVSPADLSGIRIASSRIHLVQPSSAGSPQLPGWQGGRAGCRPTALVLVLETRPRGGNFVAWPCPAGFSLLSLRTSLHQPCSVQKAWSLRGGFVLRPAPLCPRQDGDAWLRGRGGGGSAGGGRSLNVEAFSFFTESVDQHVT